MAEEIWAQKGRPYSIHQQTWPQFDVALAADEVFTLVVSVNGRVKARITVPVGISNENQVQVAMTDPVIQAILKGKTEMKVFCVPGKLVNIAV
jgi:leucyl-tRNA synthetase